MWVCGNLVHTIERSQTMSRLTIDVTDQQHQSLKAIAALQGKTIKEYALEKLFPPHADEEQAFKELASILAQRIAESQKGEVDHRTLTEIAEAYLSSGGHA
jgi:alpha-galactosidase/6-phospho-beta-glucosidase family protein